MHRSTDPVTSVITAAEAKKRQHERQIAVLKYARFRGKQGFTQRDVEVAFDNPRSGHRSRVPELERKGLLERTKQIVKLETGRPAQVWRVTSRGKKELP